MAEIGYVTLEYADAYVQNNFVSDDPLRVKWTALQEGDRIALLNRSFAAIETLPFRGRKTEITQTRAFPRFPSTTIPPNVLNAQVENAVALTDPAALEDLAFYERLWTYGVESYSIGNLSEKVSSGSWGRSTGGAANGVTSNRAMLLLNPYLTGGFRIE